ncbi:MAG: epoxide hydrolase family protein [Candidatus Binataceae bacterium]
MSNPAAIEPFQIAIGDSVLHDLHERLARTRLPDEIPDTGWEYGTNRACMAELLAHWRDRYDWREHERALNRFSQYQAAIKGLKLHFIHEIGRGANPKPLLLLHGWPGSPFEFSKIIPLLTEPDGSGKSFTVVAPSFPGFGFSDHPRSRAMNIQAIAGLFIELMTRVLGYERFGAQGGDWGSGIATRIAEVAPEALTGLHLNMISIALARADESAELSAEEKIFLGDIERFRREEAGYQWIQSTRPQTLAYGLTDSPAGWLAWIVEKFRAWSDCGGKLERRFTHDELITAAMVPWITGSIGSSMRLYYEASRYGWNPGKIGVPAAVAVFPSEPIRPPRSWAEQVYNIRRWTVMASGGHFAAMEEPHLLASDIRAFFSDLESD